MTSERELALKAKAWPFEEARKLLARYSAKPPEKGYVLLETGYGPSGLPHIGTFGEVVRTTMVRHAFQRMSDIPTRLFAFSDDMDGLRKVPGNVPNPDMLREHLGRPLTVVPDPFGKFESFGHHNNAMLRSFLDSFGFEYEFQSSSDWYKSGRFDQALLKVLQHYDEVMEIMLPTLGEERQQTYSPFLPVSPKTGRVLMVPIIERKPDAGTIVYKDEDGTLTEDAGHRRPLQAAMEARLGDALVCAGRRLRNVRQGSDRLGRSGRQDLPRPRRQAAGGLQLRALPGRERAEDLQDQGQRPFGRGMADLRPGGKPVAVHVSEAALGQAALLRRHPARRGRLSQLPRRLPAGRRGQADGESALAHPQRQAAL